MTLNEIRQRWEECTQYDRSLYIEYLCFCNYASDEDFYYFLHPGEATRAQFLSVLDFLYDQDCHVLLYRFLRNNRNRLENPDFSMLDGLELRKDIEKRFDLYMF